MPLLSDYAQHKKIDFFLKPIPKTSSILEIGSGSGWVGSFLRENGWERYQGIDLIPPADIVGDIRNWETLGLSPNSFDYLIAFEVVEHVDIYSTCETLLKPEGKLLVTTPLPQADWIMQCLERVGLNQQRTSPHSHLHRLTSFGNLRLKSYKIIAGLSQWGVFEKTAAD